MYNRVAKRLTTLLAENNVIRAEEADLYLYGFEMGLATIVGFVGMMLVGVILNCYIECAVFLVAFLFLRQYAGGYHARNYLRCFWLSCGTVFLAMLSIKWSLAQSNILLLVVLGLVGTVVIWFLAPIGDPNKPLDELERVVYGRHSKLIVIIELLSASVCFWVGFYNIAVSIICAIITVALTVCIGKVKLRLLCDL